MANTAALSAEWNMADASTEDFEPWKPDVGDMLAGVLKDVRVLVSKFGAQEEKLWLIIEGEDGVTYSWIPPSQPAREILGRLQMDVIAVGSPIGAKFVKEKPARAGGVQKLFRIWPEVSQEMRKAKAAETVARFAPPAKETEKTTVEKFETIDVSKV
jgi:hypothetical protein